MILIRVFIESFNPPGKLIMLDARTQRFLNEYWKPRLGTLKKDSKGRYLIPGGRGLEPMTDEMLTRYSRFMGY